MQAATMDTVAEVTSKYLTVSATRTKHQILRIQNRGRKCNQKYNDRNCRRYNSNDNNSRRGRGRGNYNVIII